MIDVEEKFGDMNGLKMEIEDCDFKNIGWIDI